MWPFSHSRSTKSTAKDWNKSNSYTTEDYQPDSEREELIDDYVDELLEKVSDEAKNMPDEHLFPYRLYDIPEAVQHISEIQHRINDRGYDYGIQLYSYNFEDNAWILIKSNPSSDHESSSFIMQDETIEGYIEDAVKCIAEDASNHNEDEYFSHVLVTRPRGLSSKELIHRIVYILGSRHPI